MLRPVWPPAAVLFLGLLPVPSSAGAAEKPDAEQARFFQEQVRPILQANCLSCHGGEKKDSGPAVALEKPDDSLLLQAVNHQDRKMPPKGKLAQAQIDILTRWVKMGVPWPADAGIAKRSGP